MLSDERFFHSLSVGVACPRLMSFSLTHGQAALVELMGVRVAQRLRSTDRWNATRSIVEPNNDTKSVIEPALA